MDKVNNVLEFKRVRREFYTQGLNMQEYDNLAEYLFIHEKGSDEVSLFTDFFFDKGKFSTRKASFNTKNNFYATYIIRFLEYIFNDAKEPIDNIRELTLDHIEEFMNAFGKGKLPGDTAPRSNETLTKCNTAIKRFVYWLYHKEDNENRSRMFFFSYLRDEDFKEVKSTITSPNGDKREILILRDLVSFDSGKGHTSREKVTRASLYSISKLIEIAEATDPMMVFPITLGSFAGLRTGYVLQLTRSTLKGFNRRSSLGSYIILTNDKILRSDLKLTGNIKIKKNGKSVKIAVHPATRDILKHYYERHLEYLKLKGFNKNIYGALIINNNGLAMSRSNFMRRMSKLNRLLMITVTKEASLGNKDAIKELEFLNEGNFTFHSLRYYFTNLIKQLEGGNPFATQYYRNDNNVLSQDTYEVKHTKEEIREISQKLWEEIESYIDRSAKKG